MNTEFFKNKNKIILGIILFMIISKFVLSFFLWKDRLNPPSFDDAYFYIGNLDQVAQAGSLNPLITHNQNSLSYFTYNSISYALGSLSGIIPEQMFHFFFYLGIIILPFVLYIFLKSFEQSREWQFMAIGLLSLWAFNGQTSYHGFFWIVPSFFMMLLFMSLFFLSKDVNNNFFLILLISISLFLSHPLGLFSLAVLVGSSILRAIFRKRISFRRILRAPAIFILGCMLLLTLYIYKGIELKGFVHSNSINILGKITENNGLNAKQIIIDDQENYFRSEYQDPIKKNTLFLLALLAGILAAIYLKMFDVLSFFIVTLAIGFLACRLNSLGFRLLYFTWIATFLMVACFIWALTKIEFIKYSRHLAVFLLLLFVLVGFIFNLNLVGKFNKQEDYAWNKDCVREFIAKNNNVKLNSNDKYADSVLLYVGNYKDSPSKNLPMVIASLKKADMMSKELYGDFKSFEKVKDCGFISFYAYKQ